MFIQEIFGPPKTTFAEFTHFTVIALEYTDNCRPTFAGDFIIDVLSNTNAMCYYVDTFHQCGLLNEISFPCYVLLAVVSLPHRSHQLNIYVII